MGNPIEITIISDRRNQLIDITSKIKKLVTDSGIKDGTVQIFIPHTTAAVTINENADPTVQSDILSYLEKLIPVSSGYRHSEGNSDAHIKSSLVGSQQTVLIADNKLVLGTWQGIYFCEFDGPRTRYAIVKISEN